MSAAACQNVKKRLEPYQRDLRADFINGRDLDHLCADVLIRQKSHWGLCPRETYRFLVETCLGEGVGISKDSLDKAMSGVINILTTRLRQASNQLEARV